MDEVNTNAKAIIKILGHEYALSYNPTMARDERNGGGRCCMSALTIGIDSSLPVTRQEENLIHEIIEALNYHLSLELPHDKMSALSEGLFSVMKDNMGIFRVIVAEMPAPHKDCGTFSVGATRGGI